MNIMIIPRLDIKEPNLVKGIEGLDVIKGVVKRFPPTILTGKSIKVPQIAWNQIRPANGAQWENTPLGSIRSGEYMYFGHSYYVVPEEAVQLSYTECENIAYVSSVLKIISSHVSFILRKPLPLEHRVLKANTTL